MATLSSHGHLVPVPAPVSTPSPSGAAVRPWRQALHRERWALTAAVLSGTALAVAADLWLLTQVTVLG